ncbi:membrane protein [Clostridium carboxidivorans P7]|uniref:Uncharacterized protein n=1 Tax=Clostridium carboxidivorans P7 TaxID=536227 RepID=C6PX34_9CLOT|nr:hypothetical protein [Clostridium carboxidivorans]AKN31147.1 membrane protein [Clostridium carboxidivorans P7]EET86211.1 hypothetical protein CcarbDRAFT_3351 [Clostridium carboxidivorans P7]EFG88254.1 membrane protein, putative [Clostridium carboxidivorans P7]
MFKQIFVIAKQEFKSLLKNWITIICIIALLIAPIFVYSPIERNEQWNVLYAAYQCNHALVILGVMVIPIIVMSIYYKDEITEMPVIIFSQHITGKIYAVGKFLGAYCYCLFFCILENVIWMLMPLYFKQTPYSPIPFFKYFILYSAASYLAMVAFAYFIDIMFNIKPLTIFIPMILFLSLSGDNTPKISLMISGIYMDNLYIGKALSPETINIIMTNRIFIIILAFVLIIISILKFSTEKLMNRR